MKPQNELGVLEGQESWDNQGGVANPCSSSWECCSQKATTVLSSCPTRSFQTCSASRSFSMSCEAIQVRHGGRVLHSDFLKQLKWAPELFARTLPPLGPLVKDPSCLCDELLTPPLPGTFQNSTSPAKATSDL